MFWATVAVMLAAGGATLQWLGPPMPAIAPPPGARPMQPLPSAVVAQVATIPPPNDDLLGPPVPPIPALAGILVPRVAEDRRTWPAAYYAAPFNAADKMPRIALAVSGAGLDENLTLQLLRDVPGAVDIVFSAYMPPERADTMAQAAREAGHECLLSIPMEPTGAPMVDEGPRQLIAGMNSDQYRENLFWSLSRLGGCVGASGAADNGMRGDRFVTDPDFAGMLAEITSRGLLYLDPATHAPVLSRALPEPGHIDFVRAADAIIDAAQNGEPLRDEDIRQNLTALEKRASLERPPIGIAINLNPRLVGILHDWAKGLPSRGVALVPVSATPPMPPPAALNHDPNQAKP
jgi:polysaccharide deacetylase 2 family uncharacterized protein YibQ